MITEEQFDEYVEAQLSNGCSLEKFKAAFEKAVVTNWKNIYQRVRDIMAEVSYIEKCDKTVNGQYRFVSHDQVTAKLHPHFVKHGVVVLHDVESLDQQGNRTAMKVRTRFVNIDDPKDRICIDTWGYGIDAGDKGPGKAFSYACKYALLKTFGLETGEDPDQDAKASYEAPKCVEFDVQLPAMTKKLRAKLESFLQICAEGRGVSQEEVKKAALGNMESFLSAFHQWNNKEEENARK